MYCFRYSVTMFYFIHLEFYLLSIYLCCFRYNALTFGFLQLEYYISWYQHLLEQTMNFRLKLNSINIRNCIGTVLALNGYRK